MNELYILRHGIAVEPGTPGMPDDERPLTAKGEKRMRADRPRPAPAGSRSSTGSSPARCPAPGDGRDRRRRAGCRRPAGDVERPADRLRRRDDRALAARADRGAADDRRPQPDLERPGLAPGARGRRMPPICDLKKGGIAALERTAGRQVSSSCAGSRRRG